ncbi:hypothetical protein BCR35DRAFT_204963 [Leucosporidium creatinivorum]|uniref:Uncharacterized protein n=1 Tax=Leucosporidium creatinivorum TaxID=106004 RepID=A0A1Y2FXI0_9BASI|nr:hypothetical protein BCR35DRAFT_204963 [Leucosporidium creatinivorum]
MVERYASLAFRVCHQKRQPGQDARRSAQDGGRGRQGHLPHPAGRRELARTHGGGASLQGLPCGQAPLPQVRRRAERTERWSQHPLRRSPLHGQSRAHRAAGVSEALVVWTRLVSASDLNSRRWTLGADRALAPASFDAGNRRARSRLTPTSKTTTASVSTIALARLFTISTFPPTHNFSTRSSPALPTSLPFAPSASGIAKPAVPFQLRTSTQQSFNSPRTFTSSRRPMAGAVRLPSPRSWGTWSRSSASNWLSRSTHIPSFTPSPT